MQEQGITAAVVAAVAVVALYAYSGRLQHPRPGVRPAVDGRLLRQLQKAHQAHVFQWHEHLPQRRQGQQRELLVEQLQGIDVQRATDIFKESMARHGATGARGAGARDVYEPLDDVINLTSVAASMPGKREGWEAAGLAAIARGAVAVVTMAGGQGTRLGFDGPKGAFRIGLPSNSSLFQLFAERIARVQHLATLHTLRTQGASGRGALPAGGCTITWLVMTSPANHDATTAFFRQEGYFGLSPSQVGFFQQSVLPSFSAGGRFLMGSSSEVAQSPDGNGAIFEALQTSGMLDRLQWQRVSHVHVHAVDNALSLVADPTFVGFAIETGAAIANKVVERLHPTEKMGVSVIKNGQHAVAEYAPNPPASLYLPPTP